jgi:sulfur carrier protein ThiS
MTTLKIGKLMGIIAEYAVETGTTVADALIMANLSDTDGYQIKLDGEIVSLDDTIGEDSKILILSKMVKGN